MLVGPPESFFPIIAFLCCNEHIPDAACRVSSFSAVVSLLNWCRAKSDLTLQHPLTHPTNFTCIAPGSQGRMASRHHEADVWKGPRFRFPKPPQTERQRRRCIPTLYTKSDSNEVLANTDTRSKGRPAPPHLLPTKASTSPFIPRRRNPSPPREIFSRTTPSSHHPPQLKRLPPSQRPGADHPTIVTEVCSEALAPSASQGA